MKKSIIIIVLVVAVMGGGVGFAVGKSNSSNQSKPAAATHSEEGTSHTSTTKDATSDAVIDETSSNEVTIDIKDFKYQKQNIKIKKGTKVTWVGRSWHLIITQKLKGYWPASQMVGMLCALISQRLLKTLKVR